MDAKVKTAKKVEIKKPDCELFLSGEVGAVLELTVKRQDGSIREHRVLKSKSYVRQFLELLLVQMNMVSEAHPMPIRDTGNNIREVAFSSFTFGCNAPIGNPVYGLVVGTATTAPTIDDHALWAQIAHGTGAGHIQYGDVAFGLPTATGTESHFTVTRDFSNASGATITVNEIALYVRALGSQPGNTYDRDSIWVFMTIRDVIAGGIDVLNGETLTVNYRQQATV